MCYGQSWIVATICVYCVAFFDLPLSNFWIYPLEFLEYISGLNTLLVFINFWCLKFYFNVYLTFFPILFHSSFSIFLWLSIVFTVGILSCVFELIFGIFIEICNYLIFLFREIYSLYLVVCFLFYCFFFFSNVFFFFCNILFVFACYFFYTLVEFFFPWKIEFSCKIFKIFSSFPFVAECGMVAFANVEIFVTSIFIIAKCTRGRYRWNKIRGE